MSVIDCLRLKRNYAWWFFLGHTQSLEEFKLSCKIPVLHHFNDLSTCGTWCKHRDRVELELAKLMQYKNKEVDNQLMYLFIIEIID
jgi:hypothetical protein